METSNTVMGNKIMAWVTGQTTDPLDALVSQASTRDLLMVHAAVVSAALVGEWRERSQAALRAVATELARRIDEGRTK